MRTALSVLLFLQEGRRLNRMLARMSPCRVPHTHQGLGRDLRASMGTSDWAGRLRKGEESSAEFELAGSAMMTDDKSVVHSMHGDNTLSIQCARANLMTGQQVIVYCCNVAQQGKRRDTPSTSFSTSSSLPNNLLPPQQLKQNDKANNLFKKNRQVLYFRFILRLVALVF